MGAIVSTMARLSKEERRTCIVQAAMTVFARTGFRGARTKDIARAAGVSEALLFKLFPTKRALQQAIIEERIRHAGPPLSEALASEPPRDVLRNLATRFIAMCDKDPTFMRLLYFSALEGEPLAPMFFKRRISRNIETLRKIFQTWVREGKLRATLDARLSAWSFMAIVFQLLFTRNVFGVKKVHDHPGTLAEMIVDLIYQGIQL